MYSASVTEALENLQQHQLVINAVYFDIVFAGFPFHLSLRDKHGSVVIEWIGGKTHYYFHEAFTNVVTETVDSFDHLGTMDYVGTNAAMRNAPPYGWHLSEAAKSPWADMVTGNTAQTLDVDGKSVYMNGSRMLGLPGDFTSPNRLCGSVNRVVPQVKSQDQAMRAASSIIQSLQQPPGSSPSDDLDELAGLQRSIYHFKPWLTHSPSRWPMTSFLSSSKHPS